MNSRQIRYCCLYGNPARSFSVIGSGGAEEMHITKGEELFVHARITSLLSDQYDFIYDKKEPELLILWVSDPTKFRLVVLTYMYYKLASAARRIWGWHPMMISSCYEDIPLELRNFNKIYSSEPPAPKNITCSSAADVLFNKNSNWSKHRSRVKSKFCNFLYSSASFEMVTVREAFCKFLMRYKHIDSPGFRLNNMPSIDKQKAVYALNRTWSDKLSFLKDYKFTIAFENRVSPKYLSEKIEHPLAVGSIPIYWGNPNITDYYNPAAFINCRAYESFEEVVERIIEVDNNPTLYAEYLNAPLTLPGNHYHDLKAKTLVHWEEIYAEIERRRRQIRDISHLNRVGRLSRMFLRNLDYEGQSLYHRFLRRYFRRLRRWKNQVTSLLKQTVAGGIKALEIILICIISGGRFARRILFGFKFRH